MVAHHAIGDELDAAEGREFEQEPGELLLAEVIEEELTPDDAGDAVEHCRLIRGGFEPRQAHGMKRVDSAAAEPPSQH